MIQPSIQLQRAGPDGSVKVGLKNHQRAVTCFHQKWRCSKCLLPESVILGRTETLEAEHEADRAGSHTEGFRAKEPEQELKPMLRLYIQKKQVAQFR